MQDLDHHIIHLLQRHDCVIVPGFGGFIGSYEPASLHEVSGKIFPPCKRIIFNSSLTRHDGLLAHEIASANAISYEQAIEQITATIVHWKSKLQHGERIELSEIGFLYTHIDKIVFEQSIERNLLLSSYGLIPVTYHAVSKKILTEKSEEITAKKVHDSAISVEKKSSSSAEEKLPKKKETPVITMRVSEPIVEVKKEEDKVIPIQKQAIKKKKNWKYALAAAVVLPAMFYSYWIPMKTDMLSTGKIHLSDFNPFHKKQTETYQQRDHQFTIDLSTDWKSLDELTSSLPDHVSVYSLEINEEIYIPVELEKQVANTAETSTPVLASGDFHVIAGCFSVEQNAERQVEKLKSGGYSALIFDHENGLYRVSAGGFTTESDAESFRTKLESEGYSTWILKP